MAAWVLGHTDRFQCIIDHAGVNNSYSQFATDVPHGFAKVMGGTPWENVEGSSGENPMFYAKNFKTPTLILHGELDYRVPYGNGLELYGVLQAIGVPSRLVVFPNENHWVLSPAERASTGTTRCRPGSRASSAASPSTSRCSRAREAERETSMLQKKTIAILGAGTMGQAILGGLVATGTPRRASGPRPGPAPRPRP